MKKKTPASSDIPEVVISSWNEFRNTFDGDDYRSWAFRGQGGDWPMFSTLSRYLRTWKVHQKVWRLQEERILRIFHRKAHHFLQRTPHEDDSFEWLALMQHHGAPTRLLDFTWSPYVAAFFALERADAVMWAVHPPSIEDMSSRTIRASQKSGKGDIGPWYWGNYEKHFLPNNNRIVVIGEPHNMNQRLIAQSGTFVMPGVLDKPVEEIISQLGRSEGAITKFRLVSEKLRKRAMAELYAMNITNATLFPGLDGMARSLAFELEFHWGFDPMTLETYEGFRIE